MSKHKIKYKLGVIPQDDEYVVHFQILEQDERFRGTWGQILRHKAANNMGVHSCDSPELTGHSIIYVRGGDVPLDTKISLLPFAQERDALDYVIKVRAALDDWAKNWPGFSPVAELPIFTA